MQIRRKFIDVYEEVFIEIGNILRDELGNIFEVGSPTHYSFKGEIPEWYLETVSLILKGIKIDKVGDYVRLAK
ncbi:MAG: hypothetical protein J6A94_13075 [Lachnospiraceae bacterium]|nr:hypothetical protein [Lachnospiraceae bacterium]